VFNVGPTEILVVLLIALIVFGPKRLPEVGRTVGKGLREFRRATQEIRGDIEAGLDDDEPPPAGRTPDRPLTEASTSPKQDGVDTTSPLTSPEAQAEDVHHPDGATPVA
jgi:sec-independent protein translocase protein TatA